MEIRITAEDLGNVATDSDLSLFADFVHGMHPTARAIIVGSECVVSDFEDADDMDCWLGEAIEGQHGEWQEEEEEEEEFQPYTRDDYLADHEDWYRDGGER